MIRKIGFALILDMILALVTAGGLAGWPHPSYAAGIIVTDVGDTITADGVCTLREAIQAANTDTPGNGCSAGAGYDTITFDSSLAGQTIILGGTALNPTTDMTIDSSAASNLIISGNNVSRVFNITTGKVTLVNLTVANGKANGDGGGIYAGNALTLTNVNVTNNRCMALLWCSGGGAYILGSTTLTGGEFSSNLASFDGGGLYVSDTLTLSGTHFLGNISANSGGGVAVSGAATLMGGHFENNLSSAGGGLSVFGTLSLSHTYFLSNTAQNGDGGGVYVNGSVNLTGGQFISNTGRSGGGLYHSGAGNSRLVNVLFKRNMANNNGSALYLNLSSSADILHTTIASSTPITGAAIYLSSGTIHITNSIISSHTIGIQQAGGTATEDYNLFFGNTINLSGTITSSGHSLTGNPAFANPAGDDYHLMAASAALNAGTNAGVITDFEGTPRPQGNDFDIGYDELMLPASPTNNAPIVGLTTVLYDGALGGTPDEQGFTYFSLPGGSNTATGGVTTLDTSSSNNIQAGYSLISPTLNRADGYTLRFTAQVITETHSGSDRNGDGLADRAGFSVIALSDDKKGIELGFWPDQIWAQNDGAAEPPPNTNTLFTHGESANFNTSAGLIPYELRVLGDAYSLAVSSTEILSGSLRDYTAFSGPLDVYEIPNFIFLGDDSSSTRAQVRIAHLAVITNASLPDRSVGSNQALIIDRLGLLDIDAGGQNVVVTLTVNSGVLTLTTSAPGGLTAGQISGNGSNTVVATGSLGQINTSLAFTPALIYRSQPSFSGLDRATVTINDLGHTGGPVLTGQKSFNIIGPASSIYLPAVEAAN